MDRPPIQDTVETPASSDDRLWALLAHLSQLVFPVFGALIIWLLKKEESKFVATQGLEALNFQLNILIGSLVAASTCFLMPLTFVLVGIGAVYAAVAAIKANRGDDFRYQYIIRLVK
ncbi:MAG: DUF4870 domain-containing protein [Planctomycetales bacterium]|nr:DUF4870 domain-containing protein [Planctomycetales bacterium]